MPVRCRVGLQRGDLARIVDEGELVLIVEVWEGTGHARVIDWASRVANWPLHLLEKVEKTS